MNVLFRAPQGSGTFRPLVAALVSALVLAASPVSVAQSSAAKLSTSGLPSLGDVQGMTIAAERRLGDQIAREIYLDPDYLDDPVLSDYLQAVWQPLLAAARARGDVPSELSERLAWELMVSRDRTVNAFALPGGYLGVHLGLLGLTETPQELASVLAHELSHISQRHIARMIARQESQAPWLLAGMVLAALAAGSNAEVANAAMASTQALSAQNQLNFSRDMEREADRVGFGVLTGAGFEGQGFVSMFDKLQQNSRLNDDGSFPYLRSHPLTGDRIADMKSRLQLEGTSASTVLLKPRAAPAGAQVVAKPGFVFNAPDPTHSALAGVEPLPAIEVHLLMAARARVLAENSGDRQRDWLRLGQGAQASAPELYAAALSAHRLGLATPALELAQRLRGVATPATRVWADQLLLEVLVGASRPGSGVPGATAKVQTLLAPLRDQALASATRAGILLGAQAALATGAPQKANEALRTWVVGQPRDAQAWQTLSSVWQAQGQRLRAVRAEAESRAAMLDYAGAVDRFKAAQALPERDRAADPMELAIVDTRKREVDALLRESVRDAREK